MNSIISKIIEIDMVAGQRLDDAHKVESDIQMQITKKSEQTTKAIAQKADARIAKIDEIEGQYAQEEIAQINDDFASREKTLELAYLDIHEKMEQDIFNNIVKY